MSTEDLPLDSPIAEIEQLRKDKDDLQRRLKIAHVRNATNHMSVLTRGLEAMKKDNPELFKVFIKSNKTRIRELLTYLQGDKP